MCITKTQIHELDSIISRLNSIDTDEEKDQFLKCNVEDADLFLETLKKVNKSKLKNGKKRSAAKKETGSSYERSTVFEIFQNTSLNEIVANYSKAELVAMYCSVYSSRPLSADNKERIAQAIKGYIHDMSRAETLLGGL